MAEPLLSVRDFRVDYVTDRGGVRAVDGVSFDVARGEMLGIAGESGSGKSTLALALMRILPPPAVITGGRALFEGRDLLALSEPELRAVRWKRIAMVFQSAMDALNPVTTVGEQIVETLEAHGAERGAAARKRAASLLEMVGIPPSSVDAYAHQLSGGMRQRVGIAMALALDPSLLVLDEPTTALDVIVERGILERIRELQRRLGFAVLFITHDLARMLQFSDRVAIFYAARLVEIAPSESLRRAPRHPYTQGLLRAFPSVHGDAADLAGIPGSPPSLEHPPAGCRFHPRCALATDLCRAESPLLRPLAPGHLAACHFAS
ncbi:MAG TPA: ABC transporter ATP-binding protein [Candidatus Eisenbacteria bacterium]|nr:ABC transporter ATP-binding protein [Candidatus Eisenbacteria bacterium]